MLLTLLILSNSREQNTLQAEPAQMSAFELRNFAESYIRDLKRRKGAPLEVDDYEQISLRLAHEIFPNPDGRRITARYHARGSDQYEIIIRAWAHDLVAGCGLDFAFRRDTEEYRGFKIIPGE